MTDTPGTFRRPVHPALAFVATLGVAIAMLAIWSPLSEANVICVPTSFDEACDEVDSTIQNGLTNAEESPGHDEIRIVAGNYSGELSYNDPSEGNTVDLIGTGSDPSQTTLQMGSTAGAATGFYFNSSPGSTIRNITYAIPTNADGSQDIGMDLQNVTADEISVEGPNAKFVTGLRCNECNVTDTEIQLPTKFGTIGVDQVNGSASVADSYISADYGVRHSSPGLTTTVERTRIKAHTGATTDGGTLDISNTLIRLDDDPGAVGINLANGNLGPYPMFGEFDGLTIINGAGDGSKGINAIAATGSDQYVNVTLDNSVIHGFDTANGSRNLWIVAGDDRIVDFHSTYSAYDNGATFKGTGVNGLIDYDLSPGHSDLPDGVSFADPQSDDFTPSILGGLRDAGDPADPGTGALDINGNQRACHGTDEGVIRRDIGAFEFKTDPLDDCTYPETTLQVGPSNLLPGAGPAFGFFSDKNPATFLCSWDGQPEIACDSELDAPMLGYGAHSLGVRARDQFGNIDQTPATHDYTVKQPDPTCLDDPSLCPPDKTAPRVIGVKVAKKTRAQKIKVRFKSNEAGSKFRCKLNGAKWRVCKSPWKTPKLKQGKNVIRIQATDKAGNKSKVVKRVVKKTRKRK